MFVADEDLIQGAVDGTLTPEEQGELERLLARSAPSRAELESQLALTRALNDVPLVSVPSVRDSVLERIRSLERQRPVPFPYKRRNRRRAFVLGWAAAAAVVIAVGIQQIPHFAALNGDRAGGAMTRTGVDEWTTVGRLARDGSTLTIQQNGDRFTFLPRVPADVPVTIEWNPEQLTFEEATAITDRREARGGRVTFPARSQQTSLVLENQHRNGKAVVTVTAAGKELFRWTVVPP